MTAPHPLTVRAIIRALGGPAKVAAALGVSAQMVSMWSRRNRIPERHQARVRQLGAHVVAKARAA